MKKIGLLLVIFIGLVAFVYLYEIEGEKKRQEAKEREESLFQMKQEEVTSVEIAQAGQDPVLLVKVDDKWSVDKPLETPADKASVDSLVGSVDSARIERTFEEVGSGAEKYGLQKPRMTLTVQAGELTRVVHVGSKDFTGSNTYVQLAGDTKVHLTADSLFANADKDLFQWRDKKVLTLDRDKVRTIEVQRGAEKIRLSKVGENWALEVPLQEPADKSAVSGLLSSLETTEAQKFVAEETEDLPQYGLSNPSVVIRLQEEGEDQWKALELGNKAEGEDDHYLARNPARSAVFTVPKSILEKLTQKLWEFRDKDVINVDQDEIDKVIFHRGDLEIQARREDYKWIIEKPDAQKDKEALAYKFWYPMDDIKFETIDDSKAGTTSDKADVQIEILMKDGSVRSFEFLKQGESYRARKVEAERGGSISKESFEKLQFKVEDIV